MRSFRLRIAVIAAVSGSVVMCREPTRVPAPPSLAEIMAHRAVWDSYHISDYSYVYQFDGAFNVLANQPIQIQVRADTVRAAMLVATGETLTDLRDLPTIRGLFDRAVAAAGNSVAWDSPVPRRR